MSLIRSTSEFCLDWIQSLFPFPDLPFSGRFPHLPRGFFCWRNLNRSLTFSFSVSRFGSSFGPEIRTRFILPEICFVSGVIGKRRIDFPGFSTYAAVNFFDPHFPYFSRICFKWIPIDWKTPIFRILLSLNPLNPVKWMSSLRQQEFYHHFFPYKVQ